MKCEGAYLFGVARRRAAEKGRFVFSSSLFKDAVKGSAFESQIKFSIQGQEYVLLTAVPVTRATNVWIKHESSYKPSEDTPGASDNEGTLSPTDFPLE
jgi:hypothetical protein